MRFLSLVFLGPFLYAHYICRHARIVEAKFDLAEAYEQFRHGGNSSTMGCTSCLIRQQDFPGEALWARLGDFDNRRTRGFTDCAVAQVRSTIALFEAQGNVPKTAYKQLCARTGLRATMFSSVGSSEDQLAGTQVDLQTIQVREPDHLLTVGLTQSITAEILQRIMEGPGGKATAKRILLRQEVATLQVIRDTR